MLLAETNAIELYRSLVKPLAKLRQTDPKLAEDACPFATRRGRTSARGRGSTPRPRCR